MIKFIIKNTIKNTFKNTMRVVMFSGRVICIQS